VKKTKLSRQNDDEGTQIDGSVNKLVEKDGVDPSSKKDQKTPRYFLLCKFSKKVEPKCAQNPDTGHIIFLGILYHIYIKASN
jgi:hypothetical protein